MDDMTFLYMYVRTVEYNVEHSFVDGCEGGLLCRMHRLFIFLMLLPVQPALIGHTSHRKTSSSKETGIKPPGGSSNVYYYAHAHTRPLTTSAFMVVYPGCIAPGPYHRDAKVLPLTCESYMYLLD